MRLDSLIAVLAEDAAGGDDYPAGGVVAGVVAALAASLAAAAADSSRPEWSEAGGMRAQAQALHRRALTLARRDAAAYEAARQELLERGGEVGPGADDQERDRRLGRVVEQAAGPPLELAARAADIAELARVIAARGSGDVRADAMIAAHLAAAAAQAAARLVEINLVVSARPEIAERARRSAEAATDAAASAADLSI